MPVERFNLTENLSVVAAIDQNLAVGLDRLRKESKWSLVEDLFIGSGLLLSFNHISRWLT